MVDSALTGFRPEVATWFSEVFSAPTAVQRGAWEEISRNQHALIVAPTGSGKTLAAFLWALNCLAGKPGQLPLPDVLENPRPAPPAGADTNADTPDSTAVPTAGDPSTPSTGVRVIYISPLKALGVDVERNLRAPLTGISRTAARMGLPMPEIRVGVRSGDTTAAERQKQLKNPPDILITTPESLYLMLTSKASQVLRTVDTIIIDEIHAVAGTKRGVHLALSLERLEHLCATPPQRIGLSATVRPLETVARFLGGHRLVSIVNPPATKKWNMCVHSPVPNMSDLPTPEPGSRIGENLVDDQLGLTAPLDARAPFEPDNQPGIQPDSQPDSQPENLGAIASAILPPPTHTPAEQQPEQATDPGALWATQGPVATPVAGTVHFDDTPAETPTAPTAPAPGEFTDADEQAFTLQGTTATENSIWPFIENAVYQEITTATSTLVFVNSRRTAERLTSRINELYASEHAPEQLSASMRRPPAQLGKVGDVAGTAATLIARAHHGSVSKDERATTEAMLKAGELKAVVATSSLELGIDMGAVDKVVLVQSPPSVASGLQRVGRAGHNVGAESTGSFYPLHRADLISTCVVVDRMRRGDIEELTVPTNALDVLAQQTIAMAAQGEITADDWYDTVRKAMPYAQLPRPVFDSVIDLVSGVYPSTDFSELRPRVIYDRVSGILSARPGAQRIAVTSGGTIPDRGLFGVFLVGGADGGAPRRVGELDEEMVYESRVGDVFTLGASSWRIEEITKDQVLVTPAPGHTGRLPFWNGDQASRPYELGLAIGAFRRTALNDPTTLDAIGIDDYARNNVTDYLTEQQQALGVIPDERTLVLERFRDELGDWRVILHTPFGRAINAPWALAVGHRIAHTTGMDAQAVAGDDGIIIRLPESDTEPGIDLFTFDADDIATIVTEHVGNSALFASRFRECAARALLLPRRHPGKRAPLWQQRQKAAQLLDVAKRYPSFPIILETVRECLQDVYDLPHLEHICREIAANTIRIAEVTTDTPSPFATSLLFNYTGAFMYEGDSPAAEKRAAALALDPALLAQLLGDIELKDLLDPDVVLEVSALVRRTHPTRQATTPEHLIDALHTLGPIPVEELHHYVTEELFSPNLIDNLLALPGHRVMQVRIAGREHLALTQEAALLRDALGIPAPPGVAAHPDTIPDAAEQLISRYARTHGPFTTQDVADAFGLGYAIAHNTLHHLDGINDGRYSADTPQWCDTGVIRMMRTRSLAKARQQAEPVSHTALARFITDWHHIAPTGARPTLHGVDGVYQVLEQLAGVRLPASAWETLILPSRVANYHPSMLDELCLSGDVTIHGAGQAGSNDPWIMLLPIDYAAELAPLTTTDDPQHSGLHEKLLTILGRGGGYFFPELVAETNGPDDDGLVIPGTTNEQDIRRALWELVERGLVTPDGFAPIRARLAGGTTATTAHKKRRTPNRSRLRMGRTSFAQEHRATSTPADMRGRWSLATTPNPEPTARSVAHGEAWLDRYGVVTRGSVVSEDVTGGFALAYKVLSTFENNGKALRAYVIEGLGAAQFSTTAIIDRIRGHQDSADQTGWPSGTTEPNTYLLASCDPANPYGAAIPWPDTIRGSRAAGAMVTLTDGVLTAHLSRGGKTLQLVEDLPAGITTADTIPRIIAALSDAIAQQRMQAITIETINHTPVFDSPHMAHLRAAGAALTPKGLKITAATTAPSPHTRPHNRRATDLNPQATTSDIPTHNNPFGTTGRGRNARR
ncbi:DEAD/DEAH box helicase [Corynebacterium aquilae]|uniref:DEAD/DEAH box helicase n=1 Tax=Corynebacterium aquilae TaxID=203263 RepID=UPI000951E635|nr:DEAD/DEAH box helicase [Corynebacterium aquilae]